jgi:DNA-binding NarL/FixJ family response regulator
MLSVERQVTASQGVPTRLIFVSAVALTRTAVRKTLQSRFSETEVTCAHSLDELQRVWSPSAVALIDATSIRIEHDVPLSPTAGRLVILGLSVTDHRNILGWFAAGATVYISESADDSEVYEAIASVTRGEVKCPQGFLEILVKEVPRIADIAPASQVPRLTQRETQIATLIEKGFTNHEIARELEISLSTVKNHVHSILKRVRARKRVEVAKAIRSHFDLGVVATAISSIQWF